MIQLSRHPLLTLLLLLCISLLIPAYAQEAKKSYSVLFVGNSYTFYNELPSLVQQMARRKGIKTDVDTWLAGGATLQGLYHDEKAAKIKQHVRQGKYDVIILQDQSQLPVYSPEQTIEGVRQWCSLLEKRKQQNKGQTRVVLYQTWGRLEHTGFATQMQDGLSATYAKAAALHGCSVAPVGEAWRLWLRKPERAQKQQLHLGDGSHPNLRGSYLAAAVLYGVIYLRPASKLTTKFELKGKRIALPSAESKQLQACARAAIKDMREAAAPASTPSAS